MSCPRCGDTGWIEYTAELPDGQSETAQQLCDCQTTAIQLLTIRVGKGLVTMGESLVVFANREQAEDMASRKGGIVEENTPHQIHDLSHAHGCDFVAVKGEMVSTDDSDSVSVLPASEWLQLFEVSA